MQTTNHETNVLRRRILALKDEVLALVPDVSEVDESASGSLLRARNALFEAWTILTIPPDSNDNEEH